MTASPRDATKKGRGKVPGSGGPKRGAAQLEALMDSVETFLLLATPRHGIAKALGLPVATVDDYTQRVRKRWKDEPPVNRAERRARAIRRGYRYLRDLVANKAPVRERLDVEKHLRVLEGTEAPIKTQAEITGKDGAPLIPTRDDAIEALRAVVPKIAGVPTPPTADPPAEG